MTKLFKKFSSLKLAITLFIVLAVVIFLGSIIPQEAQTGRNALINELGEDKYKILSFWGLTDIFHSWWYLLLVGLLGVNLTAASFLRVFPRAKKGMEWPQFLNSTKITSSRGLQAHLQISEWKNLQLKLQTSGWKVKLNQAKDSLVARKGYYHRLGASVTHIGILTILFGAIISLLLGYNGVIQGISGERYLITNQPQSPRSYILVQNAQIYHAPFWLGISPEIEVEIGKTKREDYANGSPKQWYTELQFFTNTGDKLTETQTASVNYPVSYGGIDFYQADWNRVLKLNFNEQNFEIKLDKFSYGEIAFTSVTPELGLLFLLPQNTGQLNLISVVGKPDANTLKNPEELIQKGHLKLLAKLSPNEGTQIGPMKFKYIGAFSKTGIQFKRSPGDWIMIAGMVILVFGVLIAFGHKRTIWAIQQSETNQILLLAHSDRAKELFKQEFHLLVSSIPTKASEGH